MSKVKVAVIYYSSTGTNEAIARAVEQGAAGADAEVRVRLVEETAPRSAIEGNDEWKKFVDAHEDAPRATTDDMTWADAVVFGTPTRFGNVASQLKSFLDSLGGLWFQGKLADKVYAGFTSANNPQGGQESTLLNLYTTIFHFGGIIVAPGYTDDVVTKAGGNPYGVSVTAQGDAPNDADLAHARFLGKRVVEKTRRLVG